MDVTITREDLEDVVRLLNKRKFKDAMLQNTSNFMACLFITDAIIRKVEEAEKQMGIPMEESVLKIMDEEDEEEEYDEDGLPWED